MLWGGLNDKKSNGGTQYFQQDRVYLMTDIALTIPANLPSGSYKYLIKENEMSNLRIRKLTPKECFAFQGYPMDKYILPPVANSKLYMQAGNSVTTPLIERISNEIIKVL